MNKKLVYIIVSLLLMSWDLMAHQPDFSSTVIMQQEDNSWILSIRAALTAFEYEVHNHFGDTSYKTPEEFQELVIKHMEENISIAANNRKVITFKNGAVRLGHETNVFFKLSGMPDDLKNISITNTTFKNIYNNQSNVSIVKEGIEPNKYTISNKNNHIAILEIDEKGGVTAVDNVSENKSVRKWIWAGVAIPVLLLGMLLSKFLRNKEVA